MDALPDQVLDKVPEDFFQNLPPGADRGDEVGENPRELFLFHVNLRIFFLLIP